MTFNPLNYVSTAPGDPVRLSVERFITGAGKLPELHDYAVARNRKRWAVSIPANLFHAGEENPYLDATDEQELVQKFVADSLSKKVGLVQKNAGTSGYKGCIRRGDRWFYCGSFLQMLSAYLVCPAYGQALQKLCRFLDDETQFAESRGVSNNKLIKSLGFKKFNDPYGPRPIWSPDADAILYNWFGPDQDGFRTQRTEEQWVNLLRSPLLFGKTRKQIEDRIYRLNHKLLKELKSFAGHLTAESQARWDKEHVGEVNLRALVDKNGKIRLSSRPVGWKGNPRISAPTPSAQPSPPSSPYAPSAESLPAS
jgi:hypothetical protein